MIVMFGSEGHEYADIFMIFVTLAFMFADSVYIFWGFSVYVKLPHGMKIAFLTTFMGFIGGL